MITTLPDRASCPDQLINTGMFHLPHQYRWHAILFFFFFFLKKLQKYNNNKNSTRKKIKQRKKNKTNIDYKNDIENNKIQKRENFQTKKKKSG